MVQAQVPLVRSRLVGLHYPLARNQRGDKKSLKPRRARSMVTGRPPSPALKLLQLSCMDPKLLHPIEGLLEPPNADTTMIMDHSRSSSSFDTPWHDDAS